MGKTSNMILSRSSKWYRPLFLYENELDTKGSKIVNFVFYNPEKQEILGATRSGFFENDNEPSLTDFSLTIERKVKMDLSLNHAFYLRGASDSYDKGITVYIPVTEPIEWKEHKVNIHKGLQNVFLTGKFPIRTANGEIIYASVTKYSCTEESTGYKIRYEIAQKINEIAYSQLSSDDVMGIAQIFKNCGYSFDEIMKD